MINELEKLCTLDGVSGSEEKIREYILGRISNKADVKVDALGNVIAFVKGKRAPKNRIMLSAHMDEVGFVVTYINDDGSLCIEPVGGIDERVVYGRRIRFGDTVAVVGGKAVHNISADERKKSVSFDKMAVDIGVSSREEAQKLVKLGDTGVFDSEFVRFGNGRICSKAIDDRAGCAILLRIIDEGVECDTYFTFVVQEEIGLRGSACAAYTVDPDIAVVLEATTASDIPEVSGDRRVCELGEGPVVSFMDRHTIYDKELYKLAFNIAKDNDITCQTKTRVAGGNDAGAIHVSRSGVRTCAISLPCRYLHSASCVIDEQDFANSYKLTKLFLDRIYDL